MVDTDLFPDQESLAVSAAVGAVTFVVGVLGTFLLTGSQRDAITSGEAFSMTIEGFGEESIDFGAEGMSQFSAPSNVDAASWLYHDAHFASTEAEFVFSGEGSQQAAETFSLSFVESAPGFLHLLPPILLLAAGYLIVRRTDAKSLEQSVVDGASVALGYGAAAVLSVFLLGWETSSTDSGMTITMTAAPELLPAVALTAIVFPVAFGALGGYVGHRSAESARRDAPGRL